MTTIRTASGARRRLPADLDASRVVGLDPEGRIVVDDFGAFDAEPVERAYANWSGTEYPFLFGLSLCCNASDKGTEWGNVCRGCYGDEAGAYLFQSPDGRFPGLDPLAATDDRDPCAWCGRPDVVGGPDPAAHHPHGLDIVGWTCSARCSEAYAATLVVTA